MKRFLSLVLSLALLLSTVPYGAFAAEEKVLFSDDFENGMGKWTLLGKSDEATNKITNEKAVSGKYSACVTDDTEDNIFGFQSVEIPAKPGVSYTISGKVFNVEGMGGYPFINFLGADKKKVGSKGAAVKGTPGSGCGQTHFLYFLSLIKFKIKISFISFFPYFFFISPCNQLCLQLKNHTRESGVKS